MKIESTVSSGINTKINVSEDENNQSNKSTFSNNVLKVKNKEISISSPVISKPNTESYMMKIGNKNLGSSITSISSFKNSNIDFSEELTASFLKPNSVEGITNKKNEKLYTNKAKKFETPKISDEQLATLSNKKKESNTESNLVIEGEGNSTRNIGYEKIQERYKLNSSEFSHVLNIIKSDKTSSKEKENKLKSYLLSNDLSMKKTGKFERFKNIFGMSNKINTIRNEQRDHAIVILANLNKTAMSKDTSQ